MVFEMFEKHDKTALQTYSCACDDYDGTDGFDFDFL